MRCIGVTSRIEFKNGRPLVCIDKKQHAPLAYTTYFEELGEYSDFIQSGYRMFFVNVSFTDLPINNVTGFTPFRTGVFESDKPDYTEFDGTVRRILSKCPDALIFPRINISMPRRWVERNRRETVVVANGNRRESMYSDAFQRDGTRLLLELVDHINSADYAQTIAGYQLCGGTTQEWMHHDMAGSFSDMGLDKFRHWMGEKYSVDEIPPLLRDDLEACGFNETVSRYGEFCCEMTARTVEHFAKKLKEHLKSEQIVGVFYGYSAFVNNYLLGLHGLRYIIDSPYIDFFSSPCCYDGNRALGIDWGDMLPSESVRAHSKLYFVECDVRTHLTRRMQDSRPNEYPDGPYALRDENGNKTVWCGPDTPELSLAAIRKAFVHQLTKGTGIWWFDMWGGWYHDETIMAQMAKMKRIAESATEKDCASFPSAQTVVFIDETAYLNIPRGSVLADCVNRIRVEMGNTGIPFDLCMVEDAARVLQKYHAAIFTAPLPSECGVAAIEECKRLGLAYVCPTADKPFYTQTELRDFLVAQGVHCYNADGCVIYCGGGFLGIHAISDGVATVSLPAKFRVKALLGSEYDETETDVLVLDMAKHNTAVFELAEVKNDA